MELCIKQLSIDFVNQDLLQPAVNDVDASQEKHDYADKLNHVNKLWDEVCR